MPYSNNLESRYPRGDGTPLSTAHNLGPEHFDTAQRGGSFRIGAGGPVPAKRPDPLTDALNDARTRILERSRGKI